RQLRESEGMSRPAFAEHIGVPARTVETMEQRASSPREPMLKAVAEKYPQYCYWLLTGKVNSKVGQTKPSR
ncbi:MAG: helix-turn-helix domain-containing protein, partial [Proteobacteria bacterium]|nr:helix-turn-helix domain-containing protein [Pseudomonadota bacterium]